MDDKKISSSGAIGDMEAKYKTPTFINRIIDTLTDPIFVKDKDHKFIFLNEAFCKFIGHKKDELIGKFDYDFFPKEQADIFWKKDDDVFRSNEANVNEESLTDSKGVVKLISTTKSIFTDDSSGDKILVGIIRDITERKTVEEALKKNKDLETFNKLAVDRELKMIELKKKIAELKNQLEKKSDEKSLILKNEELEKAKLAALNMMEDLAESNVHLKELDQAKTDFLNIASHELKTPLTAISAYLDVLDDYKEQFSKEQLQGLEAIKRNSNQLRTLIGNILELSRIESGRFELSKQDVDVEKKIVSIIDTLKVLIGEKNIELKADIGKLPVISTDELRFEEILNNLIGNAIKFTDHGIISVVATQEKDLICIKVTDTGIGIPEDKIKNLFQNFYQVDSSLGRRYGGTGLGLALTKKMIELQGGTIIAESLPGKGSTFKFTLPINLIKKDS